MRGFKQDRLVLETLEARHDVAADLLHAVQAGNHWLQDYSGPLLVLEQTVYDQRQEVHALALVDDQDVLEQFDDPLLVDTAHVDLCVNLVLREGLDGGQAAVGQQLEPHAAQRPDELGLLTVMPLEIDGPVAIFIELFVLELIPIADDVAESVASILLNNVFLEHLAGLVDEQVRGDIGDGLQDVFHDIGGQLGGNGQLPDLEQILEVAVIVVGDVGVVGPVEQVVHLLLDKTVAHAFLRTGYYKLDTWTGSPLNI